MFRTVLAPVFLFISVIGVIFFPGCQEKETETQVEEQFPPVVDTPSADETPPPPGGDFQKAPAFTLLDVDGKPVSLKDFEGKVTLINFWATWCVPCRREMPDLVKLYNQHKAEGFEVIAISMDDEETRQDIVPFMTELGMNFIILLTDGKVQKDYQLFGLPSTFLLDRAHRIRFSYIGAQPKAVFEAAVTKLLAEGR